MVVSSALSCGRRIASRFSLQRRSATQHYAKKIVLIGCDLGRFSSALKQQQRQRSLSTTGSGSNANDVDDDLLQKKEIQAMRVAAIKKELSEMDVSTDHIFEKDELVRLLVEVRRQQLELVRSMVKERLQESQKSRPSHKNHLRTYENKKVSSSVVVTPLHMKRVDGSVVDAKVPNSASYYRLSDMQPPIPTVDLQLLNAAGSSSKNTPPALASMLIDSAASHSVLRPEAQSKFNLSDGTIIPMPQVMATGEVSQTTSATMIRFRLEDQIYGPYPAAFRDFPHRIVDGILGLSFLREFAAIDFHFRDSQMLLYNDTKRASAEANRPMEDLQCLTQSTMRRQMVEVVPGGQTEVFTVDVYFYDDHGDGKYKDGKNARCRGPVTLLVDTGAAQTFLNWKGISALGLSKKRHLSPAKTAAMGGGKDAMHFSHEWNGAGSFSFHRHDGDDNDAAYPGVPLSIGNKRLSITVGDIPGIAFMPIGGILGMDLLLQCSVLRCSWKEEPFTIAMYK